MAARLARSTRGVSHGGGSDVSGPEVASHGWKTRGSHGGHLKPGVNSDSVQSAKPSFQRRLPWASSVDGAGSVSTADASNSDAAPDTPAGMCKGAVVCNPRATPAFSRAQLDAKAAVEWPSLASPEHGSRASPGAHDDVSAAPVAHADLSSMHTGAGIFVLTELGWLAGLDSSNRWQDFGGNRSGSESPWDTATREFEEETGSDASYLVSLASPYRVVKDNHVYVIHIAKLLSGAPPHRPTDEILKYRHFVGFTSNFKGELVAPEIAHRRVLDPGFLALAAATYASLRMANLRCRTTRPLPLPAHTTRRSLKWDNGHCSGDTGTSHRQAELTRDDCMVIDPEPTKVDPFRRPRRPTEPQLPSGSSNESDASGLGPANRTSCALQHAISDAIASVALAQRDDRGDIRSCDDTCGDAPQGT